MIYKHLTWKFVFILVSVVSFHILGEQFVKAWQVSLEIQIPVFHSHFNLDLSIQLFNQVQYMYWGIVLKIVQSLSKYFQVLGKKLLWTRLLILRWCIFKLYFACESLSMKQTNHEKAETVCRVPGKITKQLVF